jgi:hypothetical protein
MPSQSTDGDALLRALGLVPARRATVIFPTVMGIDWPRIIADVTQPIVIVNRISEAIRLCESGQPTIAVTGITKGKLAKWLRKRGAKVQMRAQMN